MDCLSRQSGRELEPKLAEARGVDVSGRSAPSTPRSRPRSRHAKSASRRKHALHKYSRAVVNHAGAVFVANIASEWPIKSGHAKATLDLGWARLRNRLQYKCDQAGVAFAQVDERYTTQTCCECFRLGGPKARSGLGVRQWVCQQCGTVHDRDLNAALNLARLGCQRLGLI
jgi:putative transposase